MRTPWRVGGPVPVGLDFVNAVGVCLDWWRQCVSSHLVDDEPFRAKPLLKGIHGSAPVPFARGQG